MESIPFYPENLKAGLGNILLRDTIPAYLYFSIADKKELNDFLKNVEENIHQLFTAERTAWALRCFTVRFSDYNPGYSKRLIFAELFSTSSPVIDNMRPIFRGEYMRKNMYDRDKKYVCKSIFAFQDKFPNLFAAVRDDLEPILNKITLDFIIANYGNDALKLFPKISIDEMRKLYFNLEDPHNIFIIPDDMEKVHFLQNQFSRTYAYPYKVPKMSFGCTLSLTNTSFLFSSHFLDLINHEAEEAFVCNDMDKVISVNNLIPYVYHIFIISHYEMISMNPERYEVLTKREVQDIWGSEYYNRISNDVNLCIYASKATKTKLNAETFKNNSFLSILKSKIMDQKVLDFTKNKYAMISDEGLAKDADFLLLYRSMCSVLKVMTMKGLNEAAEEEIFKSIHENFVAMSPSFRETAAVEMFSLLFIKKDDKFVCPAQIAQETLRTIEEFTNSEYIKQGVISLLPSFSGQRGLKLKSYLLAGKEALIKAIASRDWSLARKIIDRSPLYKEFFELALSVYSLVVEKELPDEVMKITPILKLEFGLSCEEGASELRNSESQYPQYSAVIGARVKALKNGKALSPFKISSKFDVAERLSREFDTSYVKFLKERKGEAFSDYFTDYTTIGKFISYMVLFSHCYFDDGPTEEVPFNIKEALNTAIRSGCIEDAKKLAEYLGIDLFEYVMNHFTDFELSKEFVNEYIEQYPLVCQAIGFTQLSVSDLEEIPEFPNILKRKVPKIDDALGSFIEALMDPSVPLCELDDYIFRIDRRKVYNTVIERIGNLSDERVLYCVDITGYDEENKSEALREIFARRDVRNTHETNPQGIIKALAESGKVETLIQYIKANNADTKENIEIAVNNLKTQRIHFLSQFPINFRYYIGLIPNLEKESQSKDLEYMRAYSRLPMSIRCLCDFWDIESVTKTIVNDEDYCHKITTDDLFYLKDADLEEILKRDRSFDDFISIAHKLFKLATEKEGIKKVITQKIINHIMGVKITSLEEELKEIGISERLQSSCEYFGIHNDFIDSYITVMNVSIFARLAMEYSFEKNSHNLEFCLFKLDATEAFDVIAPVLNLHQDQFALSRAYLMATLGIFNEIFKYLEKQKIRNDSFDVIDFDPSLFLNQKKSEVDNCRISSLFVTQFIRKPFFNHEMIQLFITNTNEYVAHNEDFLQLSIYKNAVSHCKNIITKYTFDKKAIRNDYIEHCESIIKKYTQIPKSITLFTSFGNYLDALTQCLVADGKMSDNFIKYCLPVAIENGKFKQIFLAVRKFDPKESLTSDFWNEIIDITRRKEMRMMTFEILLSRGDLEEAAHEAMYLFKKEKKTLKKLCRIVDAINCLIEAKQMPEGKKPISENVDSFLFIANIQKDLCNVMLQNNIQYCPDLINDPMGPAMACAELLKIGESNLYAKLISIFRQNTHLSNILKYILAEKDCDIIKIARNVKNIYGYPAVTHFVSAITNTKYYDVIPSIIMETMQDEKKELIVKLFIDVDCLTAALSCIEIDHSLSNLIPVIGIRAGQLGDAHILFRCEELMSEIELKKA